MTTHAQTSRGGPVVQLLRAAHLKLGLLTAAALALAAHQLHHIGREVGIVFLTALLGQLLLGWHNDLVDEPEDVRHERAKPLASGALSARTVWIVLTIGGLGLVPLATALGFRAGLYYVASVLVGMLGNIVLRTGPWSWVSWAGSYALLAPYLAYAGHNRRSTGHPPEWAMVGLFALIGIGVHVGVSLWGLVADHADGWRSLPLALGRRLGATRAFAVVLIYLGVVAAGVVYVASSNGFTR